MDSVDHFRLTVPSFVKLPHETKCRIEKYRQKYERLCRQLHKTGKDRKISQELLSWIMIQYHILESKIDHHTKKQLEHKNSLCCEYHTQFPQSKRKCPYLRGKNKEIQKNLKKLRTEKKKKRLEKNRMLNIFRKKKIQQEKQRKDAELIDDFVLLF